MGKLDGKVALINGGNKGIGRACVLLFAAEGAGVMITARDVTSAQTVAGQIRLVSAEAVSVACDVR